MNDRIEISKQNTFAQVAALGAVAGLRAMMPPALFSYAATHGSKQRLGGNFPASPTVYFITALLSAGELIADKLPSTPNRTETVGLAARIVSGGAIGGLLCAADKKSVAAGVALGVATAIAAAYAGQETRRAVSERTGIPSAALGAVEDLIAFGIGAAALEIIGGEEAE